MRVRRARPEDAAAVAAIYNQGIQARAATFETVLRTPDDRRRVIEDPSGRYPVVVAEAGNTVLGWGSLSEHSARACYRGIAECSVYIDAAHRGKGVGGALINAVIEEARRLGYWKLVSRAFLFNEASRALCRRAGFREVGIYQRHAQLDGRWLDVVIVERLLPENQPEPDEQTSAVQGTA
jgi:L-amino acid N-acyltransferase YncA